MMLLSHLTTVEFPGMLMVFLAGVVIGVAVTTAWLLRQVR